MLVDSDNPNWGEEIKYLDIYNYILMREICFHYKKSYRTAIENHLKDDWNIPVVLIAINGGPGTFQTVLEGV